MPLPQPRHLRALLASRLGGLGCGSVAANGIGANNVGQISAQAVPTGTGSNLGGAGCGIGGLGGLGGLGFGLPGGLVNPPGFGFGNPIGVGGLGAGVPPTVRFTPRRRLSGGFS